MYSGRTETNFLKFSVEKNVSSLYKNWYVKTRKTENYMYKKDVLLMEIVYP